MLLCAALATLSLLASPAGEAPPARVGAPLRWAGLWGRAWRSDRLGPRPRLVVVLHGDLAGPGDDYQYRFAEAASRSLQDAIVVAILRPGYADPAGLRSPGAHGLATGDNYTPAVIAALHAAVFAAK